MHLRRTGSVDIFTGSGSGSGTGIGDDGLAFEASFDAGVSPRRPGIRLTSELPAAEGAAAVAAAATSMPRAGPSTTQAAAPTTSPYGVTTASSKAVLGALRALQEKIRRVEGERAQALAENVALRAQLAEAGQASELRRREEAMGHEEELQEVRLAYGRALQERETLGEKLAESGAF